MNSSHELIGQIVMNQRTKERGVIISVDEVRLKVDHGGKISIYPFPDALAVTLVLKDGVLREKYRQCGEKSEFDFFKKKYISAIHEEIRYIQQSGGKKYRIIDGQLLSSRAGYYLYSFETDAELHFPDSTQIRIHLYESIIYGHVIACEEFSILFETTESLGANLEMIEFTADQWMLLEALTQRISEMNADTQSIAYQVACKGRSAVNLSRRIVLGQNAAIEQCTNKTVSFVWGPPGTGKTTTLAKIAVQFMESGKRVLMLSYSNVSVDGAVLRVARMTEGLFKPGEVIRYGYPRMQEVINHNSLTSYQFVLESHPDLKQEYDTLLQRKKSLRRNDPLRAELTKALGRIRTKLKEAEKELVQQSMFVATTVSKALIDQAIYQQSFDLVIFDEASMAYVPQVVFAAGLAKEHFCCLGDFRQLPSIVQNPDDQVLSRDIFEHACIVEAVENQLGHDWLVMLNTQYRMHQDIANFVGQEMYSGLLRSAQSISEERQRVAEISPLPLEAMGLIDLSDMYSVCIRTSDYSHINLLSAMIAVYIARTLSLEYQVGIITPYSAQSRLILAMLRDMQDASSDQEIDGKANHEIKKTQSISCATVHQFQGSEKTIIIYDAVDCYRMHYPGTLLTTKKNDVANRLFNVAITRTKGKFLMICNRDYMKRKKISKDLLFTQMIDKSARNNAYEYGQELLHDLEKLSDQGNQDMYLGDRDHKKTWKMFLKDLKEAQSRIQIDVPGVFSDDFDQIDELIHQLKTCSDSGVKIHIRADEDVILPEELEEYAQYESYITTPFTIIDSKVVWFGEPLAAPDFVTEGSVIPTKYFPCLRFEGRHLARSLSAFYEI